MRKEKNMNTQIVVSSVTGNTLKVAKAIFKVLPVTELTTIWVFIFFFSNLM